MKTKQYFILVLLVVLSFGRVIAQKNTISFKNILAQGFENNYNIKLQQLSLEKADYMLLKARGGLNSFLNTDLTYGSGLNPSLDNDGSKIWQTEFVIPTRLGVNFYSGFRLERTIQFGESGNTPFNTSGAFAGLKIPLLNGLGKSSPLNTDILVSETNKSAFDMELSNEILTYFSQLLINYLTLKQSVEELTISKNILVESEKYRDDIKALIDKDQIPLSEQSRAKSLYVQNLQQLNMSQMQATQVYFDTKTLIGVDSFEKSDTLPYLSDSFPNPTKKDINSFVELTISRVDSLIKLTPQYKSIELRVREEELLLKQARNQKQNPLDLDIRLSSFGFNENSRFNLNSTFNGMPGTSLLINLTHNLPIRNQQRRGAYLEQLTEFDISKTNLSQYLYENSINTKLKLDLLKQKVEMFDEALTLSDLMKKNYQDELTKFQLGSATQTDVIVVLEDYFDALKSVNNLKYDVWKSYIEIKFLIGNLPKSEDELNSFLLLDLFFQI